MAKKKVPINEKVKTHKDEIRFKTDDPKRMLNRLMTKKLSNKLKKEQDNDKE